MSATFLMLECEDMLFSDRVDLDMPDRVLEIRMSGDYDSIKMRILDGFDGRLTMVELSADQAAQIVGALQQAIKCIKR